MYICIEKESASLLTTLWNLVAYLTGQMEFLHLVVLLEDEDLLPDVKGRFQKLNATTIATLENIGERERKHFLSNDSFKISNVNRNFPHCTWESDNELRSSWKRATSYWNCSELKIIVETLPFASDTLLENSRGELIGQGDMIIQTLKELMPFKVEYRKRESNDWGSAPENLTDKPTGVFADIFTGDTDVCPGSFILDKSRINYVSLFHQDYGITLLLSAGPTSVPKNLRTIVSPFDLWTWIGIPMAMIFLTALLRNISRWLPEPPEHPRGTMDFLRILLQQSIPSTPKHSVTRLIYMIWWLFTMVLAVAYTSALASQMTAPKSTKPIDTIQEVRNHPNLQFYFMDYGEVKPVIPYKIGKIYKFADLLTERLQLVKSPKEAVNLVTQGKGIAIALLREYLLAADLGNQQLQWTLQKFLGLLETLRLILRQAHSQGEWGQKKVASRALVAPRTSNWQHLNFPSTLAHSVQRSSPRSDNDSPIFGACDLGCDTSRPLYCVAVGFAI
ncbi:unnamed protein product [Cyprideis torosa]|uniref:Ionotropic glutamate receptor C-terminal domain-containing protein n=1 Tax=Cyprideis torosa TaxID=163714 RepID=A0A7R8W4L0_9CRUS|nr:unnamed protein product [Cyprideis torosa]CAG0883285.1 unnamed protein product [Cyprideis torosa]